MELRREIQEIKSGRKKLIIFLIGIITISNLAIIASPDLNTSADRSIKDICSRIRRGTFAHSYREARDCGDIWEDVSLNLRGNYPLVGR